MRSSAQKSNSAFTEFYRAAQAAFNTIWIALNCTATAGTFISALQHSDGSVIEVLHALLAQNPHRE